MDYFNVLSEMVTQCSVLSWCRTWKTYPAQSVWWCVASGGSYWNRLRRTPTRNAVKWLVQNHQVTSFKNKKILNYSLSKQKYFFWFSEEKGVWNWDEQISQCKFLFVSTSTSVFVVLICMSQTSLFSCVLQAFLMYIFFVFLWICRVCQRRNSSGFCLRRR